MINTDVEKIRHTYKTMRVAERAKAYPTDIKTLLDEIDNLQAKVDQMEKDKHQDACHDIQREFNDGFFSEKEY